MRKFLVGLLILLGIAGLVLGRLGETTFAPDANFEAKADLSAASAAGADGVIVIDPGVIYLGAEEGTINLSPPAGTELKVAKASNSDIQAYLEQYAHTRITDAPDWSTLNTQVINPDAEAASQIANSDLLTDVEVVEGQIDIAKFAAQEINVENPRPYSALILFTDGNSPATESLSISWPSGLANPYVPFAYAGGAILLILGLILLYVLVLRRSEQIDNTEQLDNAEQLDNSEQFDNSAQLESEIAKEPHEFMPAASTAGANDETAEPEIANGAETAPQTLDEAAMMKFEPQFVPDEPTYNLDFSDEDFVMKSPEEVELEETNRFAQHVPNFENLVQAEVPENYFAAEAQAEPVKKPRGRRRAATPVQEVDPTIPAIARSGRRRAAPASDEASTDQVDLDQTTSAELDQEER